MSAAHDCVGRGEPAPAMPMPASLLTTGSGSEVNGAEPRCTAWLIGTRDGRRDVAGVCRGVASREREEGQCATSACSASPGAVSMAVSGREVAAWTIDRSIACRWRRAEMRWTSAAERRWEMSSRHDTVRPSCCARRARRALEHARGERSCVSCVGHATCRPRQASVCVCVVTWVLLIQEVQHVCVWCGCVTDCVRCSRCLVPS